MDKVIIYQMLPRLWGNGHMSAADSATFGHVKSLGVTHIWYTGIIRHATGKPFVKGNPGSPYAISDYYDVNPYLADSEDKRMSEFEDLVKRTHAAGLKLIIDFVPNHVARDYGTLRSRSGVSYLGDEDDDTVHWSPDNDFFYYPGQAFVLPAEGEYREFPAKATGNCYSPAPSADDWYETVRINYCDFHTRTWDKMLDILLFWAAKGVDGFRCDMVEMVPRQFFHWAIDRVKQAFPGTLFIAEVYNKETYGQYIREVGFDLLYDKSGLYDTLRGIVEANSSDGTVLRSASELSANWQMLGSLQPNMLNFLENHDEQRFASEAFGRDAARTLPALYMSAAFNMAPFMIYFGEETGESASESDDGRTSIFNYVEVPGLHRLWRHIHSEEALSKAESGILEGFREAMSFASEMADAGTFDLGYCNHGRFDTDRQFAFLRHKGGRAWLVFLNFAPYDVSASVSIPCQASETIGITVQDIPLSVKAFGVFVKAVV